MLMPPFAKAIDEFGIVDPERQRRVIVRPIAEKYPPYSFAR